VPVLTWTTIGRATPVAENTATKPVPRDANWVKRHDGFVEIAKRGGVDVLFLGDSITDAWGGEGHNKNAAGAKIFEKTFEPLKAANFGIGGDRTQHVLWRIQNGELDGIVPKVCMLMIGTNNSNGTDNTAEEIAEGITIIVKTLREKQPQMKVLLLAVFPRADKREPGIETVPADGLRKKIDDVNKIIAKLDDGKTVRYLDIGPKFLEGDGSLSKAIMPDFLHLSEKGYQIWADAVLPVLTELLSK
jgi:lysophospholipase L1-like esterase